MHTQKQKLYNADPYVYGFQQLMIAHFTINELVAKSHNKFDERKETPKSCFIGANLIDNASSLRIY